MDLIPASAPVESLHISQLMRRDRNDDCERRWSVSVAAEETQLEQVCSFGVITFNVYSISCRRRCSGDFTRGFRGERLVVYMLF